MRIALALAGILLVLATALPLIRVDEWWIRILDFPRFQIAVVLVLLLPVTLFYFRLNRLFDASFISSIILAAGYQIYQIIPYTPLLAPQVLESRSCEASSSIRVMIANVLMKNRGAEELLRLVRSNEPDILLLVETDNWWNDRLEVLDDSYPYSVKRPLENTYGIHLFSRLELGSPQIRFLVDDDVPSVRSAVRLQSGDWIDFYGLHPRPPRPKQDTDERDAEILLVGKEVRGEGNPAIVAGDMNDVAWSHTTRLFQSISGTLDPRIGRGMFNTFNAKYPLLRWPLDHVFHEEPFTLIGLKRLEFFGSDHFPVLVDLCYRPTAKSFQAAPASAPDDEREAQEKIRTGTGAGDSR